MAGAATVEKALDVLFHLHKASGARGLSEIGRALDLPKSSCHRLLASLVDREVVERDDAGRYRPGLALLSLGIGAQNREPTVRAARPLLEAEAQRLGETVFLVGRRGGRLRVLDKVEGSGFLRAAPAVGDVLPSDLTAAGQLYRVFAEPARPLDAPDRVSWRADDGREAADRAGGRAAEARFIRESGYALNRDAWIDGLSVLAVPIWQPGPDGRPRLAAVLALAAASARFDLLGEDTIAERLLPAAQAVAARLAGDGSLDGVGTRSAQTDRSRRHPSPRSVGEAGEDR